MFHQKKFQGINPDVLEQLKKDVYAAYLVQTQIYCKVKSNLMKNDRIYPFCNILNDSILIFFVQGKNRQDSNLLILQNVFYLFLRPFEFF